MADNNAGAMIEKGNLPLDKPIAIVKNKDGSVSTVRTISVNFGNGETVIPTVHPKGYIMSNKEAVDYYRQTGNNFGTFNSVEAANKFANDLHNSQAGLKEVQNNMKEDFRNKPNRTNLKK